MNPIVNFTGRAITGLLASGAYQGRILVKINCLEFPGSRFIHYFRRDQAILGLSPIDIGAAVKEVSANKVCETYKAFRNCTTLEECRKLANLLPSVPAIPVLAGALGDTLADSIVPDTERKYIVKYGLGVTATIGAAILIGASVPEAVAVYCLNKVTHKIASIAIQLLQRAIAIH